MRLLRPFLALLLLLTTAELPADPVLSRLFGDHMVVQRDQPIPVWGTAIPDEVITVELAGRSASTSTDNDGNWRVRLEPLPAGGPHELLVRGIRTVVVRDVMVGDVWVCSGQSNMEWPVRRSDRAEEVIAQAGHPLLRLLQTRWAVRSDPVSEIEEAEWVLSTPESVPDFSAVAYHFGRQLVEEVEVPIGLIQATRSASPAEAWVSRQTLLSRPALRGYVQRFESDLANYEAALARHEVELQLWERENLQVDDGITSEALGWAAPEIDPSMWDAFDVPGIWENAGLRIDGAVWFRRPVYLPPEWRGHDLELRLGVIDDFDITFANGIQIGATGPGDTNPATVERVYTVPADLTDAPVLTIAVRVFDQVGNGGFTSPADSMLIRPMGSAGAGLPLAGVWSYRVEQEAPDRGPGVWNSYPLLPLRENSAGAPSGLYNGMIAPLTAIPVRGVIWYQGESNARRPHTYDILFPALIQQWRSDWRINDLPFLFVQIAPYGNEPLEPINEGSAMIREAQRRALSLPATGMTVTMDIGDPRDIHPRNKHEVGRRLALIALAKVYGRDVVHSGPLYQGMEIEDGAIRLYFDHIGGGLVARGGELKGFAIAGDDQRFVWAEARIEGDTVVVSSPDVPHPAAVRYGWAANPGEITLFNQAGLPASPFRTDDWELAL